MVEYHFFSCISANLALAAPISSSEGMFTIIRYKTSCSLVSLNPQFSALPHLSDFLTSCRTRLINPGFLCPRGGRGALPRAIRLSFFHWRFDSRLLLGFQ